MAESHSTNRSKYSDEQKQEMVTRYAAGEPIKAVAVAMGCPWQTVWYILKQRGVAIRKSGPSPLPSEVIKQRKAERQRQWRATPEGRAFFREDNRRRQQTPERKAQKCAQSKRYAKRYPDKVKTAARRAKWQARYGITEELYDRMDAAQGGRCGICGTTVHRKTARPDERFAVDHRHDETRAIRGLLCFKCNTTIGRIGDTAEQIRVWADAAVEYLSREPHWGSFTENRNGE